MYTYIHGTVHTYIYILNRNDKCFKYTYMCGTYMYDCTHYIHTVHTCTYYMYVYNIYFLYIYKAVNLFKHQHVQLRGG